MYYVVILRVSIFEVSCKLVYIGGVPYINSCSLTFRGASRFSLITELLQLFNMFCFLYSKASLNIKLYCHICIKLYCSNRLYLLYL